MTNDLKEYKDIVAIELFDDQLYSEQPIEEFEKLLSMGSDFVKINWELIARHQIKRIRNKKIDELEYFIYCQKDQIIQKRLKEIVEEREQKGLKINWEKHLRKIYQDRFNS